MKSNQSFGPWKPRDTGHGTCLVASPVEAPARRHCQDPVTDGPVTLGARPAVPGGIVMSPVPARWLTRKRPLRRQAAPDRRVIRAAGCAGSTRAARWPGGRCRGSALRVLPPDRRSDGPERAARRSGTTPLGEAPQGGRSHVASSRASSLLPAGRLAPGARLYLGEGSEKLHETHGRGHVSGRPCPPSVTRVDPVTNDADSCARNMTPAAISSGVALRPSGPAAAAAASHSSWEPVAT